MTWILWVIAVWIVVGALLQPMLVGRERKPMTPRGAVANTVMGLAIASAIVFIGIL